MNWLSQMIHTPIDLRKQYPRSFDTRAQPNGVKAIVKHNNVKGNAARKLIIDALGNERMSSTELLSKIKKSRGGAFNRMLNLMADENLIKITRIGQRRFFEVTK
jgi:hypothetical protein